MPFEHQLKNAYIGEVLEISSDLRWATLAWLQAQGWTNIAAANSGYTLNSSWLTPWTTNSNNNVFLYKYLPELSENSIITLHMTGYATRNSSTNSYQYNTVAVMWLFNSSNATDSWLYSNALQCNYSACGNTQGTKTWIDYRSGGALTVLWTAWPSNVAWTVNMTAKINLGTGLVEYKLTSPQTHSTSATLNSTQLALVRGLKYIWFAMSPKDKSNTPTLYTVDLTVEK